MKIRRVMAADHGEMFTLQRAVFVEEGRLYGTLDVPSLNETLVEFVARLDESESWVALDNYRIVGAVSLRTYRGVPDIERLMVAPDRRGIGISSKLLEVAERAAIDAGYLSLQLVVGDLAVENQNIYEHLGWRRTNTFRLEEYEHVILHSMTKELVASNEV
jgi:tRNA (guanine37-N1)-methyltransferase